MSPLFNRHLLYIAVFLLYILQSCSNENKSFRVLDYYYPLDKIENYNVYEYSIYYNPSQDSSLFYLKMGEVSPSIYYLMTLDDQLNVVDSTLIEITAQGILIKRIYLSNGNQMIKSKESDQLLFPHDIRQGETYRMKMTFEDIVRMWYHKDIIYTENLLMHGDSNDIQLYLNIDRIRIGHDGRKIPFHSDDKVVNMRGVGMVRVDSKTYHGEETTLLRKVYKAKDWEAEFYN